MSFFSWLGNVLSPGQPFGMDGRTPGFNPDAPLPGVNAPQAPQVPVPVPGQNTRAGKALPYIQLGAGTAANLIGSRMASNAVNRGNDINQANSDKLFAMADEEKRRRDALIAMLMPQIARDMKNPRMMGQGYGQIGAAPSPLSSSMTAQPSVPSAPPHPAHPTADVDKAMYGTDATWDAVNQRWMKQR